MLIVVAKGVGYREENRGAEAQRTGSAMKWQRVNLNQSGIYIDIGLGSAANTVVPAKAGIQETLQAVLFWTPACAGVTKDFAPSGCAK